MTSIPRSLAYALANVLHPRMIWLMVWPLVLALGLWGTLAIVFWAQLALAVAEWLQAGIDLVPYAAQWDLTTATLFLAKVLILLMLVPIIVGWRLPCSCSSRNASKRKAYSNSLPC